MQHHIIRLSVSLVTFIIGLSLSAVWPSTHYLDTSANSEVKREISKLEREYLDAHLRRDAVALDRILADDFTFRHRGSMIADKAERLALIENPDFAFLSIDTDAVDIEVDGGRAYVTGRAVARGRYRDRRFVSPPYMYLRVYEKREGRWQMVSVRASRSHWD
jgi:ketosteroid isomerase-like protein